MPGRPHIKIANIPLHPVQRGKSRSVCFHTKLTIGKGRPRFPASNALSGCAFEMAIPLDSVFQVLSVALLTVPCGTAQLSSPLHCFLQNLEDLPS